MVEYAEVEFEDEDGKGHSFPVVYAVGDNCIVKPQRATLDAVNASYKRTQTKPRRPSMLGPIMNGIPVVNDPNRWPVDRSGSLITEHKTAPAPAFDNHVRDRFAKKTAVERAGEVKYYNANEEAPDYPEVDDLQYRPQHLLGDYVQNHSSAPEFHSGPGHMDLTPRKKLVWANSTTKDAAYKGDVVSAYSKVAKAAPKHSFPEKTWKITAERAIHCMEYPFGTHTPDLLKRRVSPVTQMPNFGAVQKNAPRPVADLSGRDTKVVGDGETLLPFSMHNRRQDTFDTAKVPGGDFHKAPGRDRAFCEVMWFTDGMKQTQEYVKLREEGRPSHVGRSIRDMTSSTNNPNNTTACSNPANTTQASIDNNDLPEEDVRVSRYVPGCGVLLLKEKHLNVKPPPPTPGMPNPSAYDLRLLINKSTVRHPRGSVGSVGSGATVATTRKRRPSTAAPSSRRSKEEDSIFAKEKNYDEVRPRMTVYKGVVMARAQTQEERQRSIRNFTRSVL